MHDIKELSKRIRQLSLVALVASFFTLILYLFYALYLSALILGVLFVSICIVIWLDYRGIQKYTKPVLLVMVIIAIGLLAFAEGTAAGGYQYYLPLLFALPLVADGNKKFRSEMIFYFVLSCSAFFICVFFCPQKSSWEHISNGMYADMFRVNTIGTLFVSIIFVYYSFYFEQKYAAALVSQINKAEDAMHIRTRFLSNMGHELRTPLNGITGILSLMKKEGLTPGQQEYLKLLKYCSDQMLGLVNDVLDFNKIEAGKLELHPTTFNLKQVMQQAVLPFYYRFEEKNVALKVQLDNQIDELILADDLRLVQVINNLLSNALKFTQAGQVKLVAECVKKDPASMIVTFSVQDSGIGIDIEDQQKIFESFGQVINESTRRLEGAGLGLTISQRLLDLMNSRLELTSVPTQGSTFFFTCLFSRAIAPVPEKVVEHSTFDLRGMPVLVVEDNPINLMIVSKMLKGWNAQVHTAVNGKLALDVLSVQADFKLILLDLQMPVMDGYEAIAEIKRLYSDIPVFAFTASLVDDNMKNELFSLGFEGHISKPFKAGELYHAVQGVRHTGTQLAEHA